MLVNPTHEDYKEFCCLAAYHARQYYVYDSPEIEDKHYDLVFKQIEDMEEKHPQWRTKHSPTQNVDKGIVDAHNKICDCLMI